MYPMATRIPNRLPVSSAARLGRPRHYHAVLPFVRANLALRRIDLAEADKIAHGGVSRAEAMDAALLNEIRRAAHACDAA
ncbi:MAG: hypothetical protein HZA31_00160 [Opitutae bacterium]|nr:hypothetical protein [Opitutae bacterium]